MSSQQWSREEELESVSSEDVREGVREMDEHVDRVTRLHRTRAACSESDCLAADMDRSSPACGSYTVTSLTTSEFNASIPHLL